MFPFPDAEYHPLAEPQDEAHRPCSQEGRREIEGIPPNLPRLRYASPWQPADCISWQRWYNKSATDPSVAVSMAYWPNPYSVERAELSLGSRRDRDGKPNSLTLGTSVLVLPLGLRPEAFLFRLRKAGC